MRGIVQRVHRASVTVDGQIVGQIHAGLLVLVAAEVGDTDPDVEKFADRIVNLRIFSDPEGKMNLDLASATQNSGAPNLLIVSNFTVAGDTSKSRRPSFTSAMGFEPGKEAFERLVNACLVRGARVQTGQFGAHMDVELVNDGPVTLVVQVGPSNVSN
jgi:D-tyrosyl-tRNA(Tyr) deacylase